MKRLLTCLSLGALALGCVVVEPNEEPTSTQETSLWSTGPGDSGSGSTWDPGSTWDSGSDSVSSSEVGEVGSGGFVSNDHDYSCGQQCDIWTQTGCPNGQKCTAVACEIGSNAWDSHRCVDILGWQGVGEDCQYFGIGIDGLDDCELGAMCWDQDPDTGLGTCIQFCQGSPYDPSCPAASSCYIGGDSTLSVCIPSCDPLAQDCWGDDLCLPEYNNDGFVCVLNASGEMAPYGTPCEYVNVCNTGLLCIEGARVPEAQCEAAEGCCSPICDLNAPSTCPGAGQVCESLYEPGLEPFGYEHVGVCAVPG